jgi:REP element-mobilizing transposase RayT
MDETVERPHGKDLRKGRVSLPNHAYLVTIVTESRAPVFHSFHAARTAIRCFHDPHIICHAQTLAFVVMSDHTHWLLQLTDVGNLSELLRAYKSRVSLLLEQKIWQRGFHDRALRDEDDVRDIARYIVANPLRAGLCKSVGDYSYWDAIWL